MKVGEEWIPKKVFIITQF